MDENIFFRNKKYSEFIEDFENNWLQYSTPIEKMKAYFGTIENALELFEKWEKNIDVWQLRKEVLWNLDSIKSKN